MTRSRQGVGYAQDPYRAVVLVLLGASVVGLISSMADYLQVRDPVLLLVFLAMGLAMAVLISVLQTQNAPLTGDAIPPTAEVQTGPPAPVTILTDEVLRDKEAGLDPWAAAFKVKAKQRFSDLDVDVAGFSAVAGLLVLFFLIFQAPSTERAKPIAAGLGVGICLLGAGLAWMAARYLAGIDAAKFPEAEGLCRSARVTGWILTFSCTCLGLAWFHLFPVERLVYLALLAMEAFFCIELLRTLRSKATRTSFPLDFLMLAVLGSRVNLFASVLDAAERQLGIDLRSTWALTLFRRSLEPLLLCLLLAGWLTTSFTVVAMNEQGLIERFGVPASGPALQPGLRLHLPWPLDRVFRIPVQRVETVQVGHEGEEGGGPENVLWAVEHAPNEFTLLLGNGRDLITVDAAVEYRIRDAHAWRYHCQNPKVALKAIAYRAVMRSTVNLTLSDALSQNVAILTDEMRGMVQQDADSLGLGVDILAFTVSGMHPPVPVASAYEAVVSAQLGKVTTGVEAQVFRNQTVPLAESGVLTGENTARAESAEALALAAGQSWSFRTLESQYRASPGEYLFRRRLEALEKTLPTHPYTVIDSRFLRDGGEIWTTR